jgi:hypothetical protein
MKAQRFYVIYFFLLLMGIIYSPPAYSQTTPPTPTCAICGGKNGVHSTTCRYYNPPAGRTKSTGTGTPGNIQQLNMLIDLFNTPGLGNEDEARKRAAVKESNEAKQRDEILKKERHDREMKTFKSLDDDPGIVRFDTKSDPGLSLKPLPSENAPMTMEERERQNLLKHGASVTWNYDEFSAVLPDRKIPEPEPSPELSDDEKLINDGIAMVESNGGRLAAITGRYIINVKDGVMSYLDDATYAVTSGNSYTMQELAEFDVKKITTNALFKTASQTAEIYYKNAKESVIGGLKDESIGVMNAAAINKLEEYKYFDNLSKAWKQIR